VIVDHIQYFTGERIPISALSNFLKDRGIYLIVDGIQAVGSINVDIKKEGIDILSCGGSEWLNGPQGTGFLYISDEAFINLNKTHTGWLGAPWEDYLNFERLPEPFDDARRFELGTRNTIGIAGLSESIKELLEYGIVKIENKIKSLNSILLKGLKNENFEILTPEDRIAGIVTGRSESKSSFDVFNKLKENNIIISLRNDAIRFSPHFYNTSKEIEKVLNMI
jgi:cysteine desulfurase/selenocysteine lyase